MINRSYNGNTGTGNTLIIVDDDEMNRAILTHIFEPYYSIEEAENGEQGLQSILDTCENARNGWHPGLNLSEGARAPCHDPGFFDYRGSE